MWPAGGRLPTPHVHHWCSVFYADLLLIFSLSVYSHCWLQNPPGDQIPPLPPMVNPTQKAHHHHSLPKRATTVSHHMPLDKCLPLGMCWGCHHTPRGTKRISLPVLCTEIQTTVQTVSFDAGRWVVKKKFMTHPCVNRVHGHGFPARGEVADLSLPKSQRETSLLTCYWLHPNFSPIITGCNGDSTVCYFLHNHQSDYLPEQLVITFYSPT